MKTKSVLSASLLGALLTQITVSPLSAIPFLDSSLNGESPHFSVINPSLGRRPGQDFPERFTGMAYTAQKEGYDRADLPLGADDVFEKGCMGDFNGDGISDIVAVLRVAGSPANIRDMATFYGSETGFSSPYRASFSTAGTPTIIKAMDMDRDGDLDLVYLVGRLNTTHELTVFYNLGGGTGQFSTATSVIGPFTAGSGNPRIMDAVPLNFNLDRNPDIAIADAENDQIKVYLGSGSNTFTLSATVATEDRPTRLWTADLDRDGRLDLVAAAGEALVAGTHRLTWRRNTGLGWGNTNILDSIPTADTEYTGFDLSDVNDDGWRDIVFVRSKKRVNGNITSFDNSLWWRRAVKGTPGAYIGQEEMAGFGGGWKGQVYGICGGDMDGDGDDDVFAAAGGRILSYENVRVHGDSAPSVADMTGALPAGDVKFDVADVNGDSWQDLIATSPSGNAILWYPGRPSGGFGSPVSLSTGTAVPGQVAAGEFDVDGDIDLVWSIPATGEIKRAFNRNGLGTSWSQGTIVTVPGLTWLSAANFNGDGDTDLLTLTSSGEVTVRFNSSNGTSWSADSVPSLSGAVQGVVANFKPGSWTKEVALIGTSPGVLEVRERNIFANPVWQLIDSQAYAGGASTGITAGDFDRNGLVDYAWSTGTGAIYWRSPGTAAPETSLVGHAAGTVRMLRTIDWNRDGWDDILVAHSAGVTVFLSQSPNAVWNSTTKYWTPLQLFSGGNCSDAIAVDIDHDGRMDVAAYNTTAAKLKLITHLPDVQVKVTDRAMTPGQERRASASESLYVLKLESKNSGNRSFFGIGGFRIGGFSDDTSASLDRIRIRFVAAERPGNSWVPGLGLTQAQVAASVEKVFVVRESTTQENPTFDAADWIAGEFPVSVNSVGYMTMSLDLDTSSWDDAKPGGSSVEYHIALKFKPSISAFPAPRFFVRHAPTDQAQGTRAKTLFNWPIDTALYTEAANITEGQHIRLTTSIEAWRMANFGTYFSTGAAADNADGDKDGVPTLGEYLLRTDPFQTNEMTAMRLLRGLGSSPFLRLELPSVPREDGIITVQQSKDLKEWKTLSQRIGTGAWTGFPVTPVITVAGIDYWSIYPAEAEGTFFQMGYGVTP